MLKLHFLGTSDSAGMPVSHCECEACKYYLSKNTENLSTCAYLELKDGVILLDAGFEGLATLMRNKNIKACFLTHFHPDHALGLLRLRYSMQKITCYCPDDKQGFADLFKHPISIKYKTLKPYQSISLCDIKFTAISLLHSKTTNGYIIETKNSKFAYLTDCGGIEQNELEFLKNSQLNSVFIDACFDERFQNKNHLNYTEATKILDYIHPQKGYFLHQSHQTKSYIMQNNIKTKYPYVKENESFSFI